MNLLEGIRELPARPRMLIIGSSEEYGLVHPDELPIRETNPLRPLSPYAVSKVGQDLMGAGTKLPRRGCAPRAGGTAPGALQAGARPRR